LQPCTLAGIAQLVERNLAKVEVASSNLVSRSTFNFQKFSISAIKLLKIFHLKT
jgi:hypothetical protein